MKSEYLLARVLAVARQMPRQRHWPRTSLSMIPTQNATTMIITTARAMIAGITMEEIMPAATTATGTEKDNGEKKTPFPEIKEGNKRAEAYTLLCLN